MNLKRFLFLISTFVSLILLGIGTYYHNHTNNISSSILQVSFLDVGQGDAIYIRAPNGNDVLIDGGPNDAIIATLRTVMPIFDNDIDIIIATHPDKDHIAGLATVFENFQVNTFIDSELRSGTSFDNRLHTLADNEPYSSEIIASSRDRIILDEENQVFIDILYPRQDTSNFSDTNSASIVTRLVYGTKSFLFTGDAPLATEDFLIKNAKEYLDSDVLKLGHHGSKTSTGDSFLNTVTPDYAVVSAGKNNSYHHPHANVINRVRNHGIEILSTMELGTITFQTDGVDLWQK